MGGKETSVSQHILKPISDEFKEYSTHPPKEFSAKKLTLDLSNFKFCDRDFMYLISLKNISTLSLRNCHLTSQQMELLLIFAYSIEKLDIRGNPEVKISQLIDVIGGAVAPQNIRGPLGFEKLRTIIFDAREDLVCENGVLSDLMLPERRKVRASGELTRKEELKELFNRHFHYFNQGIFNFSLPNGWAEISGDNPERSLQSSYLVTGYGKEKIEYKRSELKFETIRQVLNHINNLKLKDIFYLIEHDNQNNPVLYLSGPQKLQPSSDTSNVFLSESELCSFKSKYFRATNDRIFGETLENGKSLEETIKYLEEDVLASNSKAAYLVEYDSAGKQVFYCAHNLFQYHNKSDVWFTPFTIYLPRKFKDQCDARLFLRNKLNIYNKAEKSKLMQGEVVDISSFVTIDLKDEFTILARELKHCSKRGVYSKARLEEEGLLTEVRLIETLTRCGFLNNLQLEVLDNSWY